MPAFTLREDDPESFRTFVATLARNDEKTVAAYLTTLRDLAAWLATQPDGTPFHPALLTVTTLEAYFAHLEAEQRAPRTRAKALTAITRFCRWAIAAGQLQRNPAHQIKRPTVPALSPTELAPEQRTILKNLVERQESLRVAAIFALGYWVALRVSEVATLRLDHCVLNQRAGMITIVGTKGGKTRTLDLHNAARRALYAYIHQPLAAADAREPDSVYVFTSQRAAWLRQRQQPDHLSARGIEHLWSQLKAQASHTTWPLINDVTFHDLRHDLPIVRAWPAGHWKPSQPTWATRPTTARRRSPPPRATRYPPASNSANSSRPCRDNPHQPEGALWHPTPQTCSPTTNVPNSLSSPPTSPTAN